MSNPNMESKVKELMELKRMKEELEAEITSSRLDSTALKKALPEIASQFTKQTTARRFSIN